MDNKKLVNPNSTEEVSKLFDSPIPGRGGATNTTATTTTTTTIFSSDSNQGTISGGVSGALLFNQILKDGQFSKFEEYLNKNLETLETNQNDCNKILYQLIELNVDHKEHQKCAVLLINKLSKQIDANYHPEENGVTILMRAAQQQMKEVVQQLVLLPNTFVNKSDKQENGASPNVFYFEESKGETGVKQHLLHVCVKNKWLDLVKLLLQNKADINAVDKHGDTAVHIAGRKKDRVDILEYLLSLDPNLQIQNMNHQTALDVANTEKKVLIQAKMNEHEEIRLKKQEIADQEKKIIESQQKEKQYQEEQEKLLQKQQEAEQDIQNKQKDSNQQQVQQEEISKESNKTSQEQEDSTNQEQSKQKNNSINNDSNNNQQTVESEKEENQKQQQNPQKSDDDSQTSQNTNNQGKDKSQQEQGVIYQNKQYSLQSKKQLSQNSSSFQMNQLGLATPNTTNNNNENNNNNVNNSININSTSSPSNSSQQQQQQFQSSLQQQQIQQQSSQQTNSQQQNISQNVKSNNNLNNTSNTINNNINPSSSTNNNTNNITNANKNNQQFYQNQQSQSYQQNFQGQNSDRTKNTNIFSVQQQSQQTQQQSQQPSSSQQQLNGSFRGSQGQANYNQYPPSKGTNNGQFQNQNILQGTGLNGNQQVSQSSLPQLQQKSSSPAYQQNNSTQQQQQQQGNTFDDYSVWPDSVKVFEFLKTSIVSKHQNNPNKITIDISDESKRNELNQNATVISYISNIDKVMKQLIYERNYYKQKLEEKDSDYQTLNIKYQELQRQQGNMSQDGELQCISGDQQINSENQQIIQIKDPLFCTGNILDWDMDQYQRTQQINKINYFKNTQMLNKKELLPHLNREIKEFEKEANEYNRNMEGLFDELIKKVEDIIKTKFPQIRLLKYGSYATKLCLPWSDIDIAIDTTNMQEPMNTQQTFLKIIEQLLSQNQDIVCGTLNVQTAQVPVLKVTCTQKYDYKKLDFTIFDQKHTGIKCVDLVNNYIKTYSLLKPLVLVLKQFLHCLEMNDTYKGGLSSYSLILMLVYFIQQKMFSEDLPDSEGDLLIQFLIFYGFDEQKQKFIQPKKIDANGEVDQHPIINNYPYHNYTNEQKIHIIDPQNPSNNVSKSTFFYNKIKSAMVCGYTIIHSMYTCLGCKNQREIKEQQKKPCLILKRFFNLPTKIMDIQDCFVVSQAQQQQFYYNQFAPF